MKITYITHACLLIEVGKIKIITDPWLVGPSWGGTLWHFPMHNFTPKKLPVPDFIFFSHGHDDHFHEDTIKTFPKSWFKAKILAPNYKEKWWKESLESKFKKITYLKHNKILKIDKSLKVQVFMNDGGSVDSSLKIVHDKTTCFLQSDNLMSIKEATRIGKLGKIDIAFMMPYLTGMFPAFYKWNKQEMSKLGKIKKEKSINYCSNIVESLKPNLVIPYAVDLGTLGKNFYANFIHDNNKKDFIKYIKNKKLKTQSIILNPGNYIEFSNGKIVDKKISKYKFNKKEFLKFKKKTSLKFKSYMANEKKLEKLDKTEIINKFIISLKKNFNQIKKFKFHVMFHINIDGKKNHKIVIDFKNKKILNSDKIPKLFLPQLIIFTKFYKIANLIKNKYPMNFLTFHNGAITCKRESYNQSEQEKKFWNWIYNLSF